MSSNISFPILPRDKIKSVSVERMKAPKSKQPCKVVLPLLHKLPSPRVCLAAAVPILLPLSSTFMAWKGLCLLTNSPVPIVCVVSESMAPAFHRGDVLVLWNRASSVEVGDIPVIWFDGNPLPMVHRVVQVFSEVDVISGQRRWVVDKHCMFIFPFINLFLFLEANVPDKGWQ